ncbi:hypothetical protein EBT16_07110 [bacterium]|nr:hypothetical protein [bacterium]
MDDSNDDYFQAMDYMARVLFYEEEQRNAKEGRDSSVGVCLRGLHFLPHEEVGKEEHFGKY